MSVAGGRVGGTTRRGLEVGLVRALGNGMASAKDPVCGMTVRTERAPAQGVYGGEKVYFCSVACRKKYEATHPPG